jgi:NitT/TauT family transport system permease protein
MRRFIESSVFFLVLLVIWQALVLTGVWAPPGPLNVGSWLVHSATDGTMLPALIITCRRLLLGYVIGVCVGIPLGLLTARFRLAYDTLGVIGLGFQTLPSVCWVPLALLWFERQDMAMLFVVLMGTIWPVSLSTHTGVKNVPVIYTRVAVTMGSEGLHTWRRVIVPAALPVIIGGLKLGWAFAWRSLMAAEIYVTALDHLGLGQLLHRGRLAGSLSQVIGVMIIIMLIGLIADKILFSPWERYLQRRWGTARA